MITDDVRARVTRVAEMAGDPEVAHCAEDALYFDVLHAIANGAENPRELAAEALRTRLLTFPRWSS